uniref:ephrin-A4 isoform X3 n=1 Tax=Doryrhamphus excisus TaxID=161450 RepID=UPI0025AE973B|nr:ephrin-A4 isoform X3 [Doryrhamphus excisus]
MGSLVRTPATLPAWKTTFLLLNIISAAWSKRHAVFWNSTNNRLTSGELSIQVSLNDYLDFYCPHYPNKQSVGAKEPETLALYLTEEASFRGCVDNGAAIKRWECNTPDAPFGPVRFSEKIQRFTPFSLGFEFLPGRHYYYSSSSGSKQKQATAPLNAVCSSRTPSLPLLLLLLLLLLTT